MDCYLGRQQFTSVLLDPIDGLPLIPDDIQDRMQQISIDHKVRFDFLITFVCLTAGVSRSSRQSHNNI